MADANLTRFHLLLTEADWMSTGEPGPQVSATDGIPDLEWSGSPPGIALAQRGFVFEASPGDPALEANQRRGSARDRYGTWYTVSSDRSHIVEMLGDGTIRPFWPAPGSSTEMTGLFKPKPEIAVDLVELHGLTVTADHYLVAGSVDPPGLWAFDLHGGGSPMFIPFPVPIHPIDMAPRHGCGVLILDVSPTDDYPPRYWKLSRGLRTEFDTPAAKPSLFVSKTSGEAPSPSTVPRIDPAGVHQVTVPDPVSIVGLSDDTVLVMGRDPAETFSVIGRYDDATQLGELLSLEGVLSEYTDAKGVRLDVIGHDFGFAIDDDLGGVIYVSDIGGNQAYAFTYRPEDHESGLEILPRYYPMRSHHGRGLVVDESTAYFDTIDAWHPLVAQDRRWYAANGTLVTTTFDSEILGCQWHRIFLDGCIPPGSSVRVETRTADESEDLVGQPWRLQPGPYLRGFGSELPYVKPPTDQPGAGTWETLLRDGTGRFLQVRIQFSGTGRTSPRLVALRVYFPRFSYLDEYLPRVYAEDEGSADFLERYLAITEGLFTSLEDRIANAQILWDLRTAPDEYLAWLMSWLGVTASDDWEASRRRVFLDNANEIFAWRGTRRGLVQAVRLAIDDCPEEAFDDRPDDPFQVRIVERFTTRRLGRVTWSSAVSDPELVDAGERWSPEMGAAVLHQRYVSYLRELGITGVRRLSPTTPADATVADAWRSFIQRELGVTDAGFGPADLSVYRDYLAARYRRITVYRAEYGSDAATDDSFADLTLPTSLPDAGGPLRDWAELVTRILPIARAAHQFSVLVPVPLEASPSEQDRLLARVLRVIDRERPAHTMFDVKAFWAALRVGEARVGLETQVGRGSRFVPVTVGSTELARSHLLAGRPFDTGDRWIVGRNQIMTDQTPRGIEK